jgi:hypothetical protein
MGTVSRLPSNSSERVIRNEDADRGQIFFLARARASPTEEHKTGAGRRCPVHFESVPVADSSGSNDPIRPLEIIFIISSLLKRQPPPNFLPGIKPLRASL